MVDALIVMDVERDDLRIPALRGLKQPSVLIGLPDDAAGIACGDLDFAAAAAASLEHLAGHGHRRVALIGPSPAVYQRGTSYADRFLTGFTETAEPEEVMDVLRQYHAEMGRLILEHEGTLERFTGDGMMIFFNDPVEVPNPAERAIRMAVAMRAVVGDLAARWRKRGWDLALGVGIAQGYATIGAIGFEGRLDYGAIGTVTNLAARLCGEAAAGQILVSARVAGAVESMIEADDLGPVTLKGLARPVPVWSVRELR